MNEHYNKHYIKVDSRSRIVDAWSDGPFPEKDVTGAVCINEEGDYQLRLIPDGQENPPLFDRHGIPLYKWEDGQVAARTREELAADRSALPAPGPTAVERLRADIDFLAAMQGVSL